MSTPVYQIVAQLRELGELADTEEIDATVIRDTLEALEGELEVKATNIAKLTRNLDYTAQAIRDAAAKMLERAERVERRAESIRAYLLWAMQAADIKSIECPEFKIRRQNNPPSVIVEDWHALPDAFKKQPAPPPLVPDKVGIKEALQAGKPVPGARLFQNERLVIKGG